MKNNHIFFLYILLLSSQLSLAQKNKDIIYGLDFGSNYNIGTTAIDDSKNSYGFYAGIFIGFLISDEITIKPQILYVKYNKMEELNDIVLDGFGTYAGKWNYEIEEKIIQMPIIFQYSFTKRLYVEIGPQFGYILNKEIVDVKDSGLPFRGKAINGPDDNFDLGMVLGIGFKLTDNIAIQSRMNLSLIENDNLANIGFEIRM